VKVLRELNADIIALQEVVCLEGSVSELNQGQFFANQVVLSLTILASAPSARRFVWKCDVESGSYPRNG
jgi:hypothetical protein